MEQKYVKLPPYAKLAFILLSLAVIITILYIAQNILIPILLALLFAILLRPVVHFLNRKLKFPHVIAALVSVVIFVIFIITIILFVSWQISDITNDWLKIKLNISIHYENLQYWIKQHFHLSYNKQQTYIDQVAKDSINGNNELMGNTLSSFSDVLLNMVLIPIYTFLILLYRNLFKTFLSKMVQQKNEPILHDILNNIKTVIQSYIVGLLIEMGIVCVLTSVGLMLLGVPYAILLGVVAAILNLIPYIGVMLAGIICILAALVDTTNVYTILGVIILNVVVQFIDNNILVPKIVGNKVRINALASLVGVVTGGAIAGVAGMFLALPLIAILKVIFDRIKSLEPWGFLMGDELPKTFDWYKIKLPDLDQGNSSDTNHLQATDNVIDGNNSTVNKE